MNGRKDKKEFGRVLLADSGREWTVICAAVSSGSIKASQSNNGDGIATDMNQSCKDVED
jgi:hypothetical protein